MVLESARGTPVKEIARKPDTYPNKVILWRNRYRDKGLSGLKDKPRKGRPLRYKGLCQGHPLGKSLNGASFGSRKDLKAHAKGILQSEGLDKDHEKTTNSAES